ncbi:MAG: tRNA (adenosine(37)-N6)-dimethylallyltransferase MiaA [Clostridia bacterium]|nr:tRNA (adenosine(37)-N6)-dimethylallyltransferase MiaA [Clostridia bacterium]
MVKQNGKKVLAIVGCTGGGKTDLSIAVSKRFGCEIIICDSMQIYRDMVIGTARPTDEEMAAVPHHLVGFADPMSAYSAADYAVDAGKVADRLITDGKIPLLCGGTGLYLEAFLRGGCGKEGGGDPKFRRRMEERLKNEGAEALYRELEKVDPEAARATHPNNVKRVIRALEIYELTGHTKTGRDRQSPPLDGKYESCVVGLGYHNRETLYDRINRRVRRMLDQGLLSETRDLLQKGVFDCNQTAAQAIGYKELLGVIRGTETLESATEKLQTATRHYAKRQLTWFGSKPYVNWIYADKEDGEILPPDELNEQAYRIFSNFLNS